MPRVLSWWGGQRTRRGEHEQGVANGWLRVGLGATGLSAHRRLASTVFAVGDDYAHTSRHIVSLCVLSCDMITFDESCVRFAFGAISRREIILCCACVAEGGRVLGTRQSGPVGRLANENLWLCVSVVLFIAARALVSRFENTLFDTLL